LLKILDKKLQEKVKTHWPEDKHI